MWRVDTADSVAGTLLSVKTTSNLGGMVRVKVGTFEFGGTAFDLTYSGLDSFFLRGRSLTKSKHILVADMSDCLSLVTFFVFLIACCSDQDETVATVKKGSRDFRAAAQDTSDGDAGTFDVSCICVESLSLARESRPRKVDKILFQI